MTTFYSLNNLYPLRLALRSTMNYAEGNVGFEGITGHPFAEIVAHYAGIVPFLLDLGGEALALLPSV